MFITEKSPLRLGGYSEPLAFDLRSRIIDQCRQSLHNANQNFEEELNKMKYHQKCCEGIRETIDQCKRNLAWAESLPLMSASLALEQAKTYTELEQKLVLEDNARKKTDLAASQEASKVWIPGAVVDAVLTDHRDAQPSKAEDPKPQKRGYEFL